MDRGDNFLIKELKKGNKDAFEFVFKQYYSSLCLYAAKYTSDDSGAEDIVSSFFLNFYKKRQILQINTSLRAYLYQSIRNLCLNHLRDIKKQATLINQEDRAHLHAFECNETVYETLIGKEVEQKITEALEQLPEQCRIIFEMSRFKGMKYKEIAEVLDLSVNTIETQMSRALKKLREDLKEYLHLVVGFL
ncbi:RNA polymerase sigma-70 factor [Carboxylicivirga marina]|uniref:RNA polymerase sigma-70 factor n=1 Tax=Carboxylicivirga marina TaxID=2800988 RepID=A0ABS1HQL7_9BACT|nr:RNA polymerase sigma-70 factor [Carboxylicivirga marina]MBK3519969.1 RNA polymerase sigma-70 factor [Carboxylicivirga marina]